MGQSLLHRYVVLYMSNLRNGVTVARRKGRRKEEGREVSRESGRREEGREVRRERRKGRR